jgi:hypothetical protein
MSKSEDNPDMQVLKTSTCKTLFGKSTLSYQLGCTPESVIHLRIAKNTGGGFFSDEWIAFEGILEVLKDRPEGSPVMSHFLTPLLKGKSVNTSAFILAAMKHLKLLRPLAKGTAKKAPIKKTVSKAAIKKRATARRKKATTRTKKTSPAQS